MRALPSASFAKSPENDRRAVLGRLRNAACEVHRTSLRIPQACSFFQAQSQRSDPPRKQPCPRTPRGYGYLRFGRLLLGLFADSFPLLFSASAGNGRASEKRCVSRSLG